jgi:hypothetical protein
MVRLVRSTISVARVCGSASRQVPVALTSFRRRQSGPQIEMNSIALRRHRHAVDALGTGA